MLGKKASTKYIKKKKNSLGAKKPCCPHPQQGWSLLSFSGPPAQEAPGGGAVSPECKGGVRPLVVLRSCSRLYRHLTASSGAAPRRRPGLEAQGGGARAGGNARAGSADTRGPVCCHLVAPRRMASWQGSGGSRGSAAAPTLPSEPPPAHSPTSLSIATWLALESLSAILGVSRGR